jgi:L-ascorbate metabolism protein UlaG (beta-lactamase superfamily)
LIGFEPVNPTNLAKTIEQMRLDAGVMLWCLGGASVALKSPGATLYIDLFTGPSPEPDLHKGIDDVIVPDDIHVADIVLCTHSDVDHCHRESLLPLVRNTTARFVGPRSCTRLFREWGIPAARIVELAPAEQFAYQDILITACDSNDYFDADAVTYLIRAAGVTLFEAGDTLYYSGFRRIGAQHKIDVALLNFAHNPPDEVFYMPAGQVARAAQELGTRIVVPKHWDLWQEFRDDPTKLVPRLAPQGIVVKILKQGENLEILYPLLPPREGVGD